ncbi:MAG: class I SAM-dependent methyltransferase [Burkholderiales bacterium]|nr:class I SAM-dependent methyltransferase [Burkholderiales bacterium]
MWDERYSATEYAYGTAPNDFLKAHVSAIPKGKVLSLAEGEGRNAVFLAQQGYTVTAVDASIVGLSKAQKLADAHQVSIECIHADLAHYDLGEHQWDGIISIFCPLPSSIRQALYKKLVCALKPQGVFLLEAYTPAQIGRGTGGGNSVDLMQSAASLRSELTGLTFTHLVECERPVIEGVYHTGVGAVVQAIAINTME